MIAPGSICRILQKLGLNTYHLHVQHALWLFKLSPHRMLRHVYVQWAMLFKGVFLTVHENLMLALLNAED